MVRSCAHHLTCGTALKLRGSSNAKNAMPLLVELENPRACARIEHGPSPDERVAPDVESRGEIDPDNEQTLVVVRQPSFVTLLGVIVNRIAPRN